MLGIRSKNFSQQNQNESIYTILSNFNYFSKIP